MTLASECSFGTLMLCLMNLYLVKTSFIYIKARPCKGYLIADIFTSIDCSKQNDEEIDFKIV